MDDRHVGRDQAEIDRPAPQRPQSDNRRVDPVTLAIHATPAFVASAVEFVEATTIVLAVGVTRGWRAPLIGTLAAAATLAVIIATLGVAIVTIVPELLLKGVVGSLLLLFGLRWLRKAALRHRRHSRRGADLPARGRRASRSGSPTEEVRLDRIPRGIQGGPARGDRGRVHRDRVRRGRRDRAYRGDRRRDRGGPVRHRPRRRSAAAAHDGPRELAEVWGRRDALQLRRVLVRRSPRDDVAGRCAFDPLDRRNVPRRELARGADAEGDPAAGRARGRAQCLTASGRSWSVFLSKTASLPSARFSRLPLRGRSRPPAAPLLSRSSDGCSSRWSSCSSSRTFTAPA